MSPTSDPGAATNGHPTRAEEHALGLLSPFELKARLIAVATESSGRLGIEMLDAGRGNPNWIATTPREAFFLLGHFAMGEATRVWTEPDLAGMPEQAGIASRLREFLRTRSDVPGAQLLTGTLDYGDALGFDADAFAFELTDGIIGDHYPGPDRICVHTERIVREYLADELCQG